MPPLETEVLGVNFLGKFGSQWAVVSADDSADPSEIDVDIEGRNVDIAALLDGGQSIVWAGSNSNDGTYTVATGGASDNGDGTATIPVDEAIPDDTDATGAIYYRPVVGGQTDAELSVTAGLVDMLVKGAGIWGDQLPGRAEWDLSIDNVLEESDGSWKIGANGNVELLITYNATQYTISDLDELTITLSSDFNSTAGLDEPLWRFSRPTGLNAEIETTGSFLDPASNAGTQYDALFNAFENRDPITFTLNFGSALSITGDVAIGNWTLTAPSAGDKSELSFTLPNAGQVSRSGNIDEGLGLLLEAWFQRWRGSALLEPVDEETQAQLSGATAWRGETWIDELSLEASTGDPLEINGSIRGEGKIERFTT